MSIILFVNIAIPRAHANFPSLATAIQALFHPKKLGLVEPPSRVNGQEWFFVYGGSSRWISVD